MSTKANLKAAKAALDAEDYEKTISEAQAALKSDPKNYFATLFLGRAYEKQKNLTAAAESYFSAAKFKPDDSQAWLGLCSVYEAQGSQKIDEYYQAAVKAAEIFAAADDRDRCQSIIDKLVGFTKQNGSTAQHIHVLKVLLPESPVYDLLEGRIQHPSHTYTRLAELTENEEARQIKQEVNERRTRIGARIGQVTTDVKREVMGDSDLEQLYQQVIDWSSDDDVRRCYEEKLLERAYEALTVMPADQKANKLDQVLTLAEGMVIIKHAFPLAWNLVLESRDMDDLRDLDVNILREYVSLFPEIGLAKVLQSWLNSVLLPFPPPPKDENADAEEAAKMKGLSPEDRLLLMTEGISAAELSPLAYRLVSDYYLHLDEHQSAVDTARNGLKVLSTESIKLGMSLQNTQDALKSTLGTALVQHQAPRNHAEARKLFEDVLTRKPRSTPALIGLGLIFEENEKYNEATSFFSRALAEDRQNVRVGTELAWCRALCGHYVQAQQELEQYLPILKIDDPRSRDLRAQVVHRIGICIWQSDTSRAARKSRSGAYLQFLSAIKTNVNFAPAYTSLGIYYADYAKDKKRARQCFQKAFELSAAETEAAERLANLFADQSDWDIVEVIAQRVVDSGRARPPPGSKKKGISWPFSALGVVQMGKQDYQHAIVSFLAALRISPDNYQSYIGLGESYHNSGRYNSALRTFNHALGPPEGLATEAGDEKWFGRYMIANVHRELGEYDEALAGLEAVLIQRPAEFGVLMSLLQTFVENGLRCYETGLFGQAIESAKRAISTATSIAKDRPDAFNLWKAIGDACFIFSGIQSSIGQFPAQEVEALINTAPAEVYELLREVDQIDLESLTNSRISGEDDYRSLRTPLTAGILAYKRAVSVCAHDIHAQAVAWYNLGWAEDRARYHCDLKRSKKHLKSATRCFKRAIELEAGNAEFWNALGVVTTTLNPKVAQHSFVRSLHLNELNAKVWTNLGVLYVLQNDFELAHKAFGRAQSTDPDYAHAWLGAGLLALLQAEQVEALNHFTHAFEISESSSVLARRQYSLSSFDHLLSTVSTSNDLAKLIQPLFALDQIRILVPEDFTYRHLASLLLERVGNHHAAIEALTDLCVNAETDYETSETLTSLARFAQAKCDLARNQLAARMFEAAAENAEMALDLSSDDENSGLDAEPRRKVRLSAHLTAGLAYYHLKKTEDAINMFRTALQESDNNPDVVCLLAKMLWAHGGKEEASVAREQLFECVEKHPDHVGSVTLLGVIAALSNDVETLRAITDDLSAMRTSGRLKPSERNEIENILMALSDLSADTEAGVLIEAQTAIVLKPDHPLAWGTLAEKTGEGYPALMTLRVAQKTAPPVGDTDSVELSKAFASVGTVGSAQRAVFLTPWESSGWESLADAIQ